MVVVYLGLCSSGWFVLQAVSWWCCGLVVLCFVAYAVCDWCCSLLCVLFGLLNVIGGLLLLFRCDSLLCFWYLLVWLLVGGFGFVVLGV